MKILLFDLETFGMDFGADKGFIMVASYKWQGDSKIHTITRKNPHKWTRKLFDDKEICREMARVIGTADMMVTWNGTGFDLPFLQTRMLYHRLGYLPPIPHEDGLRTARKRLKMRRSLDNVQKFFGLGTKKEPMDLARVWMPAAMGDPVALKQVIKRCESDVKLLEEAYDLIGPMSVVHPNVALVDGKPGGCPFCGKVGQMQRRGTIPALRHYRHRFHCKCGRWSTSMPIKYGEGKK